MLINSFFSAFFPHSSEMGGFISTVYVGIPLCGVLLWVLREIPYFISQNKGTIWVR